MGPNFKAALFDLDGTLLHTMRYWRIAPLEFALVHDFYPNDQELCSMRFSSARKTVMNMCEKRKIKVSYADIMRELEDFVGRHYLTDAKIRRDAENYLRSLKQRGIAMCIATGSPARTAVPGVKHLGLDRYFDYVFGGYDFEIDKHDPDYFKMIARLFGVQVSDLCVFEDALYSMKAAKQAGCSVIAIEEELQIADREEIKQTADLYIQSFTELL